MNRILYGNRCRCNEEISVTKKRKVSNRSEGKPLQYPKSNEITSKTFQIQYRNKLSLTSKLVLNSFQNKYIYYAIDDILYTLKCSPFERDNLLSVLYSPIISLQNNFSVNFFDIWIRQVYIEEVSKPNKFLKDNLEASDQITNITIQFFYKTRIPIKKQESLW
jgi:hypothetical protein